MQNIKDPTEIAGSFYNFRYCKLRNRFRGKISSDKEVYRSLADARQGRLTQDDGILSVSYARFVIAESIELANKDTGENAKYQGSDRNCRILL